MEKKHLEMFNNTETSLKVRIFSSQWFLMRV